MKKLIVGLIAITCFALVPMAASADMLSMNDSELGVITGQITVTATLSELDADLDVGATTVDVLDLDGPPQFAADGVTPIDINGNPIPPSTGAQAGIAPAMVGVALSTIHVDAGLKTVADDGIDGSIELVIIVPDLGNGNLLTMDLTVDNLGIGIDPLTLDITALGLPLAGVGVAAIGGGEASAIQVDLNTVALGVTVGL